MKKKMSVLLAVFLLLSSAAVYANDETHKHQQMEMNKSPEDHKKDAATLHEAATALENSRSDLASKLHKMAEHHDQMAQ